MATISTRINSSGTYLVNGTFDEITTSTIRTTTNTVYASLLDEVTYNTVSPAIKNLFKYTETFNFDYTNWTLNGGTMTQDATLAPNGRSLAPKLVELASLGNQRIYNWMPVTAGTTYTYSIFLKAAERYIVRCYFEDSQSGGGGRVGQYLNLQTGTVISTYLTGFNTLLGSNLQFVGNGWYRFSWTVTAQLSAALNSTAFMIIGMADSGSNFNYTGNGTSGMYIWGAQMEVSNAVTDYQGIAAANTLVAPGFVKRETSDGSLYVTDKFDEVTGMVITNGLILQFDPGKVESFISNGTRLVDISGNTRNATLLGSVTYDSTSSSLLFDSPAFTVDNRIALTAGGVDNTISFTDGSEYTIECWCKIASDAAVTYHSIAGRGTTNPWLGILKNASSYNLFFRELGATYFYSTTINVSVFTGWTQVVFSVNTSRVVSYYVNHAAGTFTDTDTVANTFFTINRLAAGYTSSGNYYAFDGNIGPINIYNRALSAAEVTNNFEALRDRFGI